MNLSPENKMDRGILHYANKSETYHPIHLEQLKKYANFFSIPEFHAAVKAFSGESS